MNTDSGTAAGDAFRPGNRLDQVADTARTDPAAAIAGITAILADRLLEPAQVMDYQVLLAELHGHTGELPAATSARDLAADTAARLDPPDLRRMLTVLAVSADLALRAGESTALTSCYSYMRDCAKVSEAFADVNRLIIAGALMAVAEYQHQDCGRGRDRVDKLIAAAAHGPLARMLGATATAMRDGCRHKTPPPQQAAPPLPGVILQPRCDRPDEAALAARVGWHPGSHPDPPGHCRPRPEAGHR